MRREDWTVGGDSETGSLGPGHLILRWSVPGSVFLLVFFGLRWTLGLTPLGPLAIPSLPILGAIASTIPIGFIIYQGYFLLYNRPMRFLGDITGKDRATAIFERVPAIREVVRYFMNDLHWELLDQAIVEETRRFWLARRFYGGNVLRLTPRLRSRVGRLEYGRMSSRAFSVVRQVVAERAYASRIPWAYNEVLAQFDIFHALGCSRIAMLASSLSFLIVSSVSIVFSGNHGLWLGVSAWFASFSLSALAALVSWRVLSGVREHVRDSALDRMVWICRSTEPSAESSQLGGGYVKPSTADRHPQTTRHEAP